MVDLELDRLSRAVRVVVVVRPRGCFRRSGVATEALGRCAKSIIAVDDGKCPYGRQIGDIGGGQGSKFRGPIRSALFFSVSVIHREWRLAVTSNITCWSGVCMHACSWSWSWNWSPALLAGTFARSPSEKARIGR